MLNTPPKSGQDKDLFTAMGEVHAATSADTPLRPDAFDLSDEEKIDKIAGHFEDIMNTLGLDLTDDSLRGTPYRVAKMYVKEIFSGLNPANRPPVSKFENRYQYNEMLIEKNITLHSHCEHHFVPIVGHAHVGYFSSGQVIGLSKINRLVQYCSSRPQVQERLTVQIAEALREELNTENVGVVIDAKHFCVASRGIQDTASTTITYNFSGKFKDISVREEFLRQIQTS